MIIECEWRMRSKGVEMELMDFLKRKKGAKEFRNDFIVGIHNHFSNELLTFWLFNFYL
jgi:hypothetical protein